MREVRTAGRDDQSRTGAARGDEKSWKMTKQKSVEGAPGRGDERWRRNAEGSEGSWRSTDGSDEKNWRRAVRVDKSWKRTEQVEKKVVCGSCGHSVSVVLEQQTAGAINRKHRRRLGGTG